MSTKPQVLLSATQSPCLAGLPVPLRAALLFQGSLEAERIVLCTQSGDFVNTWSQRLKDLPWMEIRTTGTRALIELVKPGSPILILAPGAIPQGRALADFLCSARSIAVPSVCLRSDTPVAAYYPDAAVFTKLFPPSSRDFPLKSLETTHAAENPVLRNCADPEEWLVIRGPQDLSLAEKCLFASLASDKDGYIARVDRRISIEISKRLIYWPITPNQITTVSLALGLLGALGLACADYPRQLLGAAALWLSAILDGCDGEIARLKLLKSKAGGRYDLAADHIVHVATFAAICTQIVRTSGKDGLLAPIALLAAGVVLSMFAVWRLILRTAFKTPNEAQKVYERLASRDYVYLILVLIAIGKLKWFLWAAAVGSHLFWASLIALYCQAKSQDILHEENA